MIPLSERWPSPAQLVTIGDCAAALASTIRRRVITTDPNSPARLPFSGANSAHAEAAVHSAIDNLDYVVHGHSLKRYLEDSETWRKQGWPLSIARWVLATPGDVERPEIAEQAAKQPPRLAICTDTWGWGDDVVQPYQAIFRALATIKFYFGHLPVFSINTWAGSADWLRGEVALPGLFDAEVLEPVLDYWFNKKWCRKVRWGGRSDLPWHQSTRGHPPEIDTSGTYHSPKEDSAGLPIEWVSAIDHFAETLKQAVLSHDPEMSDNTNVTGGPGQTARTTGTMSSKPVNVQLAEISAMEVAMSDPPRDQVFISYSRKDKRWLTDLQTHLKPHVRQGSIVPWSDEDIQPGSKWYSDIRQALARTRVAVLLVTPNFLASDFIHEHELTPLLKEAETGGVTILWIPVSASSYQETSLQSYQAIGDPEKPLALMKKALRDKAWVDICKTIANAVNP